MSYSFNLVIPCFNEEKNIKIIYNNLKDYLIKLSNYKIIFIDDGSTDKTWNEIVELSQNNSDIQAIKFSKNFGKEVAIEAGIHLTNKENFLIILDADSEHPINQINEMIDCWLNGYKIVLTYRISNSTSLVRELGAKIFYFMMRKFTDTSFLSKSTDFMLIDKDIIKIFNQFDEKSKSIRSIINWIGFNKKIIPIKIEQKRNRKSSYNFIKLSRLAINTFTSFSIFPIKLTSYLGLFLSIISLILLPILTICHVFNYINISIQTLIIIFNIFLTGITLTSIGFLGIYVSKINENVLKRPSYLIEEAIGINDNKK